MHLAEATHQSTLLYRLIFADYYTGSWPDGIIARSCLFDETDPEDISKYATQFAQLSLDEDWSKLVSVEEFYKYLPQVAVVAAKSSWNRSSTDDLRGYANLPWVRPTRTQLRVGEGYGRLLIRRARLSDRVVERRLLLSAIRTLYGSQSRLSDPSYQFSAKFVQIEGEEWILTPKAEVGDSIKHRDDPWIDLNPPWKSDGQKLYRPRIDMVGIDVAGLYTHLADRAAEIFPLVCERLEDRLDHIPVPYAQLDLDDSLFDRPLKPRDVLFAVVSWGNLHYERWTPVDRIADTVSGFYTKFISNSMHWHGGEELREYKTLAQNLKDTETLAETLRNAEEDERGVTYLDWRSPNEGIIRRPERSVPAVRIDTPSDIEELPCVEAVAAVLDRQQPMPEEWIQVEDSDTLSTDLQVAVGEMVTLLRGCSRSFSDDEIRTYFRNFTRWHEIQPHVEAALGQQWRTIPKGCAHDRSKLVDNCVGWDNCPYRITGSIPLSPTGYHRIHNGRQEDE